ncbi:hypothetical protein AUJ14_00290 [Candidatus Micrarchaeota archaeon CG1_02_55_22]|nr:MAG: hypothetical protein AUJ14_00290 [Candidatus Micrarchaeota archaeon CG1_02_55_22]
MQAYFDGLETTFNAALSLAKQARAKKLDPSEEVEIAPAADVAARVEGLVGPAGVTQRIRELSALSSREHACFEISKEIVQGKFVVGEYAEGEGVNSEKRIEQAVRTGLALFTEGVVSAPIEGISHVKIRDNPDGSKFLALYFAGPIRGAGGTGQAFALLIADHCRQIAKISNYRPTGDEVDRYVEECNLYARKTRAGQYVPTQEEITHIVKSCAVCIDGEPTEDYEVSSNRNLASVPSNRVRSGLVLVISEGVCLKAAKVLKISKKAGLDWSWVEKLIKVTKQDASKVEIKPNAKFMHDIVAGRPIFSYPMRPGGWRLRYGRTPFTGIAAKAIHPAAMHLLGEFPAIGTQLKVERPGKGCIVTPCANIEGPTVRLKGGDVVQVNSLQQAQMLAPQVDSILFLGDMLINYGDFSKANHLLVPSGYVEEWFVQDLDAVGVKKTVAEAGALSAREAITLAVDHSVPLAPKYSYCWQDIDASALRTLVDWLSTGKAAFEWFDFIEYRVPNGPAKEIAENLGIPHRVDGNDVVFDVDYGLALLTTLGLLKDKVFSAEKFDAAYSPEKSAMEIISATAPFKVRNRVGIYIGSSMGRPEKAKPRLMKPPVHSLFPIGMHGGKLRSVVRAVKTLQAENTRAITVEAANKLCPLDGTVTWRNVCPVCKGHTVLAVRDSRTGKMTVVEAITDDNKRDLYSEKQVDLVNEFKNACEKTNTRLTEMKAVMGLISPSKIPEPLEKGVLRAKYGITVFRDGTGRFDATEVPATHFSCRDASITVEQAKALGYTVDVKGNSLQSESQVIELKPQDIILASDGIDYLLRLTAFIDDLLLYFYGLEPYYNCKTVADLLGKQGILIAPHTSAGILTRVIGFSPVRGVIAHPYVHCATRRNCVPGESMVYYENDGAIHTDSFEEMFAKYADSHKVVRDRGDDVIELVHPVFALGATPEGNFKKQRVRKIIRRQYDGGLVKVICENNQELAATPDHRALVYSGDHLVEKRMGDIVPGEIVASLAKGSRGSVVHSINLIDEFLGGPQAIDLSVRTNREFCQRVKKEAGGWNALGQLLGVGNRELSNWFSRGKYAIPLPTYALLRSKMPWIFDEEQKFRLGFKRNFGDVKSVIDLDASLAEFLGLYVSEGWCWKSKTIGKQSYHVGIAASDEAMRKHAAGLMAENFGVKVTFTDKDVSVTSRVLFEWLSRACGKGAHSKRVPEIILNSPECIVAAFLSGAYQGDGCVEAYGLKYVSVSHKLVSQMYFLLTRMGFSPTLGVDTHPLTTGIVFDKYVAKNLKPPTSKLHYLRAYGDDARQLCKLMQLRGQKGVKAASLCKIKSGRRLVHKAGDLRLLEVKRIENTPYSGYVYDFELEKGSGNIFACGSGMVLTHNCDGDELCFILLLDGLLNFSRFYLPASRGGQMDAPLVLTIKLDPKEVDDEVHAMDCAWSYPKEFYEATQKVCAPGEVKLDTVASRLGTPSQFEGLGYTHDAVMEGPVQSSYVKLGTMAEKVEVELELMKRIRAVDVAGAAERIILAHFFPDLYGNLRSFSKQSFRCVECNSKYRRVPLQGKCSRCGGKILLTINKGGIEKYLRLSKDMAERYNLPTYLKQRLILIEKEIESIFENEAVKQYSIADYL